MKTIKNSIVLSCFSVFLILSSCTENFEEINTNPNGFNTIDPGSQITKIQLDIAGIEFKSWANNLGICSPLVQHLGGSWWTQHGGQYNVIERSHWYELWEGSYPNEIKNVVDLVHRTKDEEAFKNTRAAARILKVYLFSKLTDLYGDIPYSEAGRGFIDKILQPKYDRQEDIYTDFFKELDEAVNSFDDSLKDVQGDLMFNGDIEKWKRFGNSLRMRLGFRIAKVNPSESEKQVKAAISGGVMLSNDDTCMVIYGEFNSGGEENRGNANSQVFRATSNSEGFRLTNTLVDFMKNTQDPRLSIYGGTYLSVSGSEYGQDVTEHLQLGITYGAMWWSEWADFGDLFDGNNNFVAHVPHAQKHMQPSKYVAALNAPFFHMTYAEVEFLLAEAAIRNWGETNAQMHFEKGIRASMEMVSTYPGAPSIDSGVINDFVIANPLPATSPDNMRVIHEQMWVNFFLNGEEAYADFRRSGYPALVPFTSVESYTSGTGGIIPRRYFYPEFEATNNPINYQEAVDRMGGTDDWLNRVWWDVE